MNSIEFPNQHFLVDWPCRICLPYGVDLLQLARWVDTANKSQRQSQFDIVVSDQSYAWSGSDPIDLYNEIQTRCMAYLLPYSYVICNQPRSILCFDMYERFSLFSAELEVLRKLYPFSREIMWENFVLFQEEDDDLKLAEVFQAVQSV